MSSAEANKYAWEPNRLSCQSSVAQVFPAPPDRIKRGRFPVSLREEEVSKGSIQLLPAHVRFSPGEEEWFICWASLGEGAEHAH